MPDRYLGQLLGRYRTSRLLGTGTFSWVYEAANTDSGTAVALKVLKPEFVGQTDAKERFEHEAQTARQLRHPNIVAVHEVGVSNGTPFVAMDIYQLSLARRLELVHRLSEADTIRIGLDVASALTISHSAGIVHRDIKPDNILLDDGVAVLADFGLATRLDTALPDAPDATLAGGQQVMGTPHYFSPEQARGQQADGRSDLYSLGVLMFRAVTGKVPYEGEDWQAVSLMHINAEVPSARDTVPELTTEFDELLRKLLAKNPDERVQSATRLIDALAQLDAAPEREVRSTTGSADATLIAPAPLSAVTFLHRRNVWLRRVAFAAAGFAISAVVFFAFQQGSNTNTAETVDSLNLSELARAGTGLPDSSLNGAFGANDTANDAETVNNSNQTTGTVRSAYLTVDTESEAVLTVDNRRAVRGARIEITAGKSVRVQARIANADVSCKSTAIDTTVRLRAGETKRIELAVRPCGNVELDAQPAASVITMQSLKDGSQISVRADTTKTVKLPVGRYTYSASMTGYHDFHDGQFTVSENQTSAPLIRVRLLPKP